MMITSFHHSSNFIFLYRMFRWLTHLFCNIQRKIFFLCMLFLRFYYDENVLSFLPTPPEILKESLWCFFFLSTFVEFLKYLFCMCFRLWSMSHGAKKTCLSIFPEFFNNVFFFSEEGGVHLKISHTTCWIICKLPFSLQTHRFDSLWPIFHSIKFILDSIKCIFTA